MPSGFPWDIPRTQDSSQKTLQQAILPTYQELSPVGQWEPVTTCQHLGISVSYRIYYMPGIINCHQREPRRLLAPSFTLIFTSLNDSLFSHSRPRYSSTADIPSPRTPPGPSTQSSTPTACFPPCCMPGPGCPGKAARQSSWSGESGFEALEIWMSTVCPNAFSTADEGIVQFLIV